MREIYVSYDNNSVVAFEPLFFFVNVHKMNALLYILCAGRAQFSFLIRSGLSITRSVRSPTRKWSHLNVKTDTLTRSARTNYGGKKKCRELYA